ncbi:MAG: ZPR1 zinc finger domain-containing protein [Candidatus Jordarchaeum sp.]|uniref:ZPR1 zinc finger domain-containing protein n=1 Tax=Candidatus Jordarchaeum sp. TaxID=2823881 RepID=UPI00404A3507
MEEKSECPVCGKNTLESSLTSLNIPYFSEIFLVRFYCPSCGYSINDFLNTRYGKPIRCTYEIKNEKDLTARVIRASTGTIRIPELGTLIEPGPAAQSFITNVEGVIIKILDIAEIASKWVELEDEKKNCEMAIEKIKKAQSAEIPFTLIIEDPFGNSMIITKDQNQVKIEELTEKELENLRTGGLMVFTPCDPNKNIENE